MSFHLVISLTLIIIQQNLGTLLGRQWCKCLETQVVFMMTFIQQTELCILHSYEYEECISFSHTQC